MMANEERAYQHEEEIWRKFYLTFNDDNEVRCDDAFAYNDYKTAEDVRNANFGWVETLRQQDDTDENIVKFMPEAAEYL